MKLKFFLVFLLMNIAIYSTNTHKLYNESLKLYKSGKVEEAINLLEKEKFENQLLLYNNKELISNYLNDFGYFYYMNEKYDKALNLFKKAREFDSKRIYTYINIGDTYNKIDRIKFQKEIYSSYKTYYDKIVNSELNIKIPPRIYEVLFGKETSYIIENIYQNNGGIVLENDFNFTKDDKDIYKDIMNIKLLNGFHEYERNPIDEYKKSDYDWLDYESFKFKNNQFVIVNHGNTKGSLRMSLKDILVKKNNEFKIIGEFSNFYYNDFLKVKIINDKLVFILDPNNLGDNENKRSEIYLYSNFELQKVLTLKYIKGVQEFRSQNNSFVYNELKKKLKEMYSKYEKKELYFNLTYSPWNVSSIDIFNNGKEVSFKKRFWLTSNTRIEDHVKYELSDKIKQEIFTKGIESHGLFYEIKDIVFFNINEEVYTVIFVKEYKNFFFRILKFDNENVKLIDEINLSYEILVR